MKRRWETEELVDHWTLLPAELDLLANKTGATRVGFAVLLKSFQVEARFPQRKQDVPGAVVVTDDLFARVPPRVLRAYRQRAAVEETYELRRHPTAVRLTLLAAFCWLRSRELTDTLVDVLLQLVHYIGAKAERKVEHELLDELRHVTGKTGLLLRIAEASVGNPDGLVRDVVFPAAGGEQTLHDVVRELKASGSAYQQRVHLVMRNAYRAHYRRAVPHLLHALTFRSNNAVHRPVIRALAVLARYDDSPQRYYRPEEAVPLDGVVPVWWRELVIEADTRGNDRITRIPYELCVLQRLRDKVRCKEIWVAGADRYRNPDDDLPADFDAKRDNYYTELRLPSDADEFIDELQRQMRDGLAMLDRGLPTNPQVKILRKNDGWIQLSPLEALPEPLQLDHLKAELGQRWPMTSLLDILKEADLRIGFTEVFKSPTAREVLDRRTLRKRLLLCLYGLGTNAGLKRMSGGERGDSYKDLLYVRHRFISKEHLRAAIAQVANATFRARALQI